MIKLKSLIYESKILIPRRSGPEREKRWIQEIRRKIQDYIKKGCVGDLNLRETPVKILPDNLKKVGGNLDLSYSKIEDLNNLEYVGGILIIDNTLKLKSLGNLKFVGDNIYCFQSNILNFMSVEEIKNKVKIIGTIKTGISI
jgi:hypothetical protein